MCLGEGVEVSVCLVVDDSLLRGSTSVHELLGLRRFGVLDLFCGLWGLALDILPIPIGGATIGAE